MQTNRTPFALTALIILAAAMLAMRQPINLDVLDARTTEHAVRIAQLELEIGTLEKALDQLREDCCGTEPGQPANPEPELPANAALPIHDGHWYYLRVSKITRLDADPKLLEDAQAKEAEAARLSRQAAKKKDDTGADIDENERRAMIARASELRAEARLLRRKHEHPGVSLTGTDAQSRLVTIFVTGNDQRRAERFMPGEAVKARGRTVEFTETYLVIEDASVLPHRTN